MNLNFSKVLKYFCFIYLNNLVKNDFNQKIQIIRINNHPRIIHANPDASSDPSTSLSFLPVLSAGYLSSLYLFCVICHEYVTHSAFLSLPTAFFQVATTQCKSEQLDEDEKSQKWSVLKEANMNTKCAARKNVNLKELWFFSFLFFSSFFPSFFF